MLNENRNRIGTLFLVMLLTCMALVPAVSAQEYTKGYFDYNGKTVMGHLVDAWYVRDQPAV